jgi:hypothetical protein
MAISEIAPAIKDRVWRWPLVVLILSLCRLITYLVEYAAKAAWKRYRIPRRLHNLTGDEEEVLKRYLLEETNVLTWGVLVLPPKYYGGTAFYTCSQAMLIN